MRSAIEIGVTALALCVAAVLHGLAQGSPATAALKPATILFMCPHGAAKSVLASAYFQRTAEERGLNVRVESAGTDPDPKVSPAVAAHLTRNGYPVTAGAPRKVTPGAARVSGRRDFDRVRPRRISGTEGATGAVGRRTGAERELRRSR